MQVAARVSNSEATGADGELCVCPSSPGRGGLLSGHSQRRVDWKPCLVVTARAAGSAHTTGYLTEGLANR